jgi:hypothetical protein
VVSLDVMHGEMIHLRLVQTPFSVHDVSLNLQIRPSDGHGSPLATTIGQTMLEVPPAPRLGWLQP